MTRCHRQGEGYRETEGDRERLRETETEVEGRGGYRWVHLDSYTTAVWVCSAEELLLYSSRCRFPTHTKKSPAALRKEEQAIPRRQ